MEKSEKVIFNQCYKILSENWDESQNDRIYLEFLSNYDALLEEYALKGHNNDESEFNTILILIALYQSLLKNSISWKLSEKVMRKMLIECGNIYFKKEKWFNGNKYFDVLKKNNCVVLVPIFSR
ncbi:MAG: hypothetical protein CVU99_09495 [Firmicutes bacterium HGW-Firmicutes-4]|uniref:Uncharacterized protein n=1 Tax=Acetobacterium wieringae TaxID=52694 RepID=A0A5D0WN80_9FIRM|nr:hypothetical protein [Acetobacterium wieringae]PKM60169.1 MAG: hypothetical protein CVU99_09495 [Firmicutes bacterium HGW-Firmicutes-4]TYC85554.1 hypothetical protein FXB42_09275 [Acetobacterium wieringae]